MSLLEIGQLPEDRRAQLAGRVHGMRDFQLPELEFFNSSPCGKHEQVVDQCRFCGVVLRRHQRVGVAWLYLKQRGLIADTVGSGKTGQAAALLALLQQTGELHDGARALIVVRSGSPVVQWHAELDRLTPKLGVFAATGTRQQRVDRYLAPWVVMLIGSHMLQRDTEQLSMLPVKHLIVDDVDALRHRDTATAYSIKRIARSCDRVVVMSGTPLQKKLHEMHSVLEPVGGRVVFGSEKAFRRRYVREERVPVFMKNKDSKVIRRFVTKTTGYRNVDEFARLVQPLALRRVASDIDDVTLPAIVSQNVILDLYPAQATRYAELRAGVLRVIKEEGAKVRQVQAIAAFTLGAQICAGLAALGDADKADTSVKLDWVESKLVEGDLSDEKVVVFCQFKGAVRALSARLTKAGVDHELVWGEEKSPEARFASQERFWHDPSCRVLIGTTAIEQSLNLQCSRHLINVDTLLNAARMTQLSGRIRRQGSAYETVYVHNLLTSGTQEAGYLDLLEREQGLQDVVWGETSELYKALSPLALCQLIGRSKV